MNPNEYLPAGVPALTRTSTLANFWFDTEKREQLLVRRFVRPGMTFFDVGAHIGRYTRLFSLAAGAQGRVFAFEPTPTTAAKLARGIREEHMDNVELIRAAVSKESGTALFHLFPEEYSTWNGLGTPRMEDPRNPSQFVPIASEVPVPVIRLDEFCRSRGIDRIDYFKLDVEGVEYQALLGLEEMLRRQAIGALQFEVSKKMLEGLHTTAAPLFKLLESHDYHCHSIGQQGEVGPRVSDSNSFYENYIALPAKAEAPVPAPAAPAAAAQPVGAGAGIRFSFVTIVLNGMPFLEPALKAVYDFAHEIIIVEGAVKNCLFAATPAGSSVDGTVDCIRRFPDPHKKIRLIQGTWPEKREMQNAALAHVTGDYIWLMDSDEIYRRQDLENVADLIRRDPSITQVNFIPDNFWKGFDHLMVAPYFFNPEAHYRRLFKFKTGAVFTTHRPPTLVWPGETRSTEQMNCVPGEITRAMGAIPFHYSYVVESQVAQKIELYNRYGWGKGWKLDMNQWFRDCWQAWTPANRDAVEKRWPVWTGGQGSRTVPFGGEHPEVMKDFIAAFRSQPACSRPEAALPAEDPLHAIIGSRTYIEKALASWQHIELDAPLQTRERMMREALATGRTFWNNHVTFAFLADRLKPVTYLEVGVRVGASMVQVLANAPLRIAAGVDLWDGEYAGLPNTKEFCAAQLERHRQATGGAWDLHLLHGNSHSVLKDLIERKCLFNLINVDGDHTDEGAMEDLEDALKLLTPRGAILFDDIIHPSHRSLMNVVRTFASRHPELTLFLNTKDDNGVAVFLRGLALEDLIPELRGMSWPSQAMTPPPLPPTPAPATRPTAAESKQLKVAEDYAKEKDLTKIDGDSEFARAIRNLFRVHQPRRIIETGTYLGTGTTRVIAETLRDLGLNDAAFYSIEINPEHLARAYANLQSAGLAAQVRLQRGLSVPRSLLPTMEQIEESTVKQPEFGNIFVDHREARRAKLYFAETNFADCHDDLLGRALAGFNYRPDFVLLDSGGHMGFVEFQYLVKNLAGPCLIALDDIHHIKHHKSYQFMRRDARFELLLESTEKFGFCVARFTPAAKEKAADSAAEVQRILGVRTDSIGDAVLASSMLEPIRRHYPNAKLAVLCQHHVAHLYTACPLVDSIICFEFEQLTQAATCGQIISEICEFNPDLILNSTRSRDRIADELTLKVPGARHVAIEGDLDNISLAERELNRSRYQMIVPTTAAPMTELARHAEFLHGLGITVAGGLQPVVWTGTEDETLADAFFQQQGLDPARTIAVFPGAQRDVRVYHGYADALQTLEGFRFLVFGVAGENQLAHALEERLPGRTVNLCGRSTLRETTALLKRCRLYVGAESAGAHIACAVGVPNVVLLGGGHFGRFMPYSPLTSAVALPLECFGCNWRCKHSRTHCIKDVSPAVLAAAIRETLAKPATDRPRLFLQAQAFWHPAGGVPGWQSPKSTVPVETIVVSDGTGMTGAGAETSPDSDILPEAAEAVPPWPQDGQVKGAASDAAPVPITK
jgi:FkbM family methyltransferase